MLEEIKFQEGPFLDLSTQCSGAKTGLLLAFWLISWLLWASPTQFFIFFILHAWAAKVSNSLLFLSPVFTPLGPLFPWPWLFPSDVHYFHGFSRKKEELLYTEVQTTDNNLKQHRYVLSQAKPWTDKTCSFKISLTTFDPLVSASRCPWLQEHLFESLYQLRKGSLSANLPCLLYFSPPHHPTKMYPTLSQPSLSSS